MTLLPGEVGGERVRCLFLDALCGVHRLSDYSGLHRCRIECCLSVAKLDEQAIQEAQHLFMLSRGKPESWSKVNSGGAVMVERSGGVCLRGPFGCLLDLSVDARVTRHGGHVVPGLFC